MKNWPKKGASQVPFTIPGGASGIVDTVTVTVNGHTQTIVYTFGS